ncbi:PDZ/DHR/GLGF domain protein [Cooperia oncophora]
MISFVKERLEDAREASHASPMATQRSRQRAYLKPALDPENTVIVFPSDESVPMGIEVTGVHDDPASTSGRLSAVQILRIEPDGRVGMDGRLAVGDNIVEIDYRPVYQMSIVRARAYLSELQSRAEPSLTVARPPSSFADDPFTRSQPGTSSLQNRPILSALQQANTVHIGHTRVVELKKSKGYSTYSLFF